VREEPLPSREDADATGGEEPGSRRDNEALDGIAQKDAEQHNEEGQVAA
jgi:hypothetical protein